MLDSHWLYHYLLQHLPIPDLLHKYFLHQYFWCSYKVETTPKDFQQKHIIEHSAFLQQRSNFAEDYIPRSEEHTSELQSRGHLVCRLLLEKKHYNIRI